MPVCLNCHSEFANGQTSCPWCGTAWKPPLVNPRLKWLLIGLGLAATLTSLGIALTWPWFWDVLFRLGLRSPLLNSRKLEQFLKAEEWEQADRKTAALIYQATKSQTWNGEPTSLAWSQIRRLSCADLQNLDRLWLEHSSGRFGFSVQRQIYDRAILQGEDNTNPQASSSQPSPQAAIPPQTSRRARNSASAELQRMSDSIGIAFGETNEQREFREQVGWNWQENAPKSAESYEARANFSIKAPTGHLPSYGVFLLTPDKTLPIVFSTDAFAERQKQCGL